jgi:murein DD-endopeptidase MepM/ murein hydrolase activator NlpD
LDGKVHSFKNNNNLGDYGPTIILEHKLNNHVFYTLYGHLALESIESIKVGDLFAKGQQLALLGDSSVNGDYAPHLHFQIIKDIDVNFGDYPGVSSKTKLAYYLENCPDPNLLLKIY